ncbi:MAG TPA: outer membrane protein assembly factor BamA [Candidatus Omnitrophica bacterium]|nr:outer membrane protein assembly factor BamA [Candidatus Omnitrophota bacterium]
MRYRGRLSYQFSVLNYRIILVLVAFVCAGSYCFSSEEASVVKKIEISGNMRVSSMIILSKIRTKEGEVLSPEVIRQDIKNIYALGYFYNISVDVIPFEEGMKVTYIVEEKPYVEKIELKGNRILTSEEIERVMALGLGDIYMRKTLDEDIKRITKLYEQKGYYNVKIAPEVEVNEQEKKVFISLSIDEGPRTKVRKIEIIGNVSVSEREIKAKMKTKEAHFFRRGVFGKEEFEKDLERIVTLYQSHGYLDAKVKNYNLEYAKEGRLLFITIEVEEGPLYKVKEVLIVGNELFSSEELLGILKMKKGDPYNPHGLAEEVDRLRAHYAQKGYIATQVWEEPSIDSQRRVATITYHIEEGPKTYVRLVKIKGNTRTKDKVIRREITIKPGEQFDGDKIKRSREKIYNLGYFKEVRLHTEPTDRLDLRDLVFEVEERKTGALAFGFGYSTMEKLIGFIQIQQDNFDIKNPPTFTGGGQKMKVRARFGDIRKDYLISFTEPYFRDCPLSLGFDLYDETRYWSAYSERLRGGDIRVGRRLTDYLRLDTMYKYEVIHIFDLKEGTSKIIEEEEGRFDTSSLTVSLRRDTRDNIFIPTDGSLGSISVQYAGGLLGGDRNFVKYTGDSIWYFPVIKTEEREKVISLRLRVGIAEEFSPSENVPISERFFIGGAETIRGYPYREVGPEDEDDNPIGGKSFFIANVEYIFPLWKKIIRGAVFYDTGNAWRESDEIDFTELVSGVGVGLKLQTPIGPINLDYAYGIQRKKWRFHFTAGYSF